MNEALRGHVTRVGFNLTLSIGQIGVLVTIAEGNAQKADYRAVGDMVKGFTPWAFAVNSNWVTGVRGLERRGLIEHHVPKAIRKDRKISTVWTISPAGEHVVGLLKEAGIYQEIVSTLVLKTETA